MREGIGDDSGQKIESAGGYLEYRIAPGYLCEIVNIEVISTKRRKGYGRAMVCELISWCRLVPHKARAIYVITRNSNVSAKSFYESLGFVILSKLPNFYPMTDGDAVMYYRGV